jgi:hypothetical protein
MREPAHDSGDGASGNSAPDGESLGTPIRVFRATSRDRVIIAVCGAAMLGCGTFIAFFPPRGSFFGPFLAGWGAVVLWLALLLGNQRLLICPGGVLRIRGRKQECCRWDEISEIVEARVQTRGTSSRRCSLVKRDGTRILVQDLNVGRFESFVDTLRQLSEPHRIPWKKEGVTLPRFDWMRWVVYGIIGFSVLLSIVSGVVLLTVK